MGHKVNPIGLRLGINRTWDSRWYAGRNEYSKLLHEDLKIRDYLRERLAQAGVVPIDIMGTLSELQGSWNRPDAQEWASVYTQAMPHYQLLIESYIKAQEVANNHEELDSERK